MRRDPTALLHKKLKNWCRRIAMQFHTVAEAQNKPPATTGYDVLTGPHTTSQPARPSNPLRRRRPDPHAPRLDSRSDRCSLDLMCKTQGERERESERDRENTSHDQKVADTTVHERFCCDYIHTGVLGPPCPADPTSRHPPRPALPPARPTRRPLVQLARTLWGNSPFVML
jgi:hypothetical protein